jgi:hypothetical protein
MQREHQELGVRVLRPNAAHDLQTGDERQQVFEEDDVGLGFLGFGDGLFAIGGFADHLQAWVGTQNSAQSEPDKVLIIDNQNACHDTRRSLTPFRFDCTILARFAGAAHQEKPGKGPGGHAVLAAAAA